MNLIALGISYGQVRRKMSAAYERGRDSDFGDWRSALERHRRGLRRLAERWPRELGGRLQVLDHLRALLAEDGELALSAGPIDLVRQRQEALRAMARPLGRRLFGEPTPTFKRRVQECCRTEPDAGRSAAFA